MSCKYFNGDSCIYEDCASGQTEDGYCGHNDSPETYGDFTDCDSYREDYDDEDQNMHYGDKIQLEKSKLQIVVYKHEVLGSAFKRNKNGIISKRCVDYEICSIIACEFISPRVIRNLLNNPYKYLAKSLDHVEFETWNKLDIKDDDGWGKLTVTSIQNVDDSIHDIDTLH